MPQISLVSLKHWRSAFDIGPVEISCNDLAIDPAIVAQSIRGSGYAVPRFNGVQLDREMGNTPVHISPSKTIATGKLSSPGSRSARSTNSSPSANRIKEIHEAATWRGDHEGFVKGQSDKSDVFFVASKEPYPSRNFSKSFQMR